MPLHQVSIVPGHTIVRVGVCDTGCTRLGQSINVQWNLCLPLDHSELRVSTVLSNVVDKVHSTMREGDFLPPEFTTVAVSSSAHV